MTLRLLSKTHLKALMLPLRLRQVSLLEWILSDVVLRQMQVPDPNVS